MYAVVYYWLTFWTRFTSYKYAVQRSQYCRRLSVQSVFFSCIHHNVARYTQWLTALAKECTDTIGTMSVKIRL